MIDNVPLIQNPNDAQQINASIIAMKKASKELDEKIVKLNSLNSELDKKIALLDSGLNKEIEDRKEAINSLDVPSVGGSGKYISAISETDGKISATAGEITSTVSSGNSQPVTSGGVADAIAPLQPIDSVTNGNLHPVTSNAVADSLERVTHNYRSTFSKSANSNAQWAVFQYDSGKYITSSILPVLLQIAGNGYFNSFVIDRFRAYAFRDKSTWVDSIHLAEGNVNPAIIAIHISGTNVFNGVATITDLNGMGYLPTFLGMKTEAEVLTLSRKSEIDNILSTTIKNDDLTDLLINVSSGNVTMTIGANAGTSGNFTFAVPDGYKVVGFNGYITSGPGGAINLYSINTNIMFGKTGTFTQQIFFRNYTSVEQTATINVFLQCQKIF